MENSSHNNSPSESNKRKHPRLIKSFIVKVKTQGSQIAKWDMPVLIDISEGGCHFYGSQAYELGTLLDMQIQIPKSSVPIPFIAKVKRVRSDKMFNIIRYEISVSMSTSEHDMKKKFIESLNFFFQSD